MGGSSSAVDNACSGSDIAGSTFVSFSSSALIVSSDSTLTSTNNTFSNTSLNSPELQLYNTILANGSQCVKDAADGKNDLVQASGYHVCGLTDSVNGNIVSFSANLGALTGWPAYFVLGYYSSAINAGDNSICAAPPVNNTSENGLTRPQGPGTHCDIGSYEGSPFNPATDVPPDSALTLGAIKKRIESTAESRGYTVSSITCTQDKCGDPINTHTGVFSFSTPDISIPTDAGNLVFQRTYSSGAAHEYIQPLGHGWTDNQSAHLIFPADPDGIPGYIQFQDTLGNRNLFKVNGDGSYSPGPGVLATLMSSGSGYIVTTPEQAKFNFDMNGKITSMSDPQGHVTQYTYDSSGKLIGISADGGTRYLALSYDDQGRIVSVSDYAGRSVTFSYDSAGELASSTDVLGRTWTYTYDFLHRMTQMTDPSGIQTMRTDYDISGRAYQQFDSKGNLTTQVVYNADGSATITDANGNTQTHSYDSRGVNTETVDQLSRKTDTVYAADLRPTSITNAAGQMLSMEWSADGVDLLSKTDAAGNKTANTYDSLHNLTSTTDPLENVTTYTYNGTLLTSKTDASGGKTIYAYTADGQLASETDSSGQTTSYTYDSHGQKTSMTDAQGNTTAYTYDALGRLTDTIDARGRDTHNVYDAAGELLSTTVNYDPSRPQNDQNVYNIVTSYQYDDQGNQIASTDTFGYTTHYVYDDNGHLIKTTDPAGDITNNTYNADGQLVSTTDALGRTTSYTYDAVGRQLTTINALGISSGTTTFNIAANTATASDALGHTATYYYDSLERVVKVVDALGNTTTTTYDANGNKASTTDALGRITTSVYDGLNRLIKTIEPDGSITTTVYDSAGNRAATIDALGNRTSYTYDNYGRLIAATDPLGRVTRTEYNQYGQRTASIDAAGNRTTYTYDLLDRLVSTTDPAGNTTTSTYDALGRVIAATDANSHTTWTSYDAAGRVLTTTDANGKITTNAYDAAGNLIKTTDALGKTTIYTYDALNRRVAATDPSGHTTHTSYDALGNVTDQIDANGVDTHTVYDVLGRPVGVVKNYRPGVNADAQTNAETDYTYNAVGNRITVKDPDGHVTTFAYDALNRVIQKTDALGNTWTYTYDLDGNQLSTTNANGKTTKYTYEADNELTGIQYPSPETSVSFTYTNTGQRASMTDGLGTTTWNYDTLGRLVSVTDPYGKTVHYAYDAAGNRTALIYPDGKQVSYTYDAANRLAQAADWSGKDTQYSYDAVGHLLSILHPNSVTSDHSYDAAGRLTQLNHVSGQSNLAAYGYTYDANGHVTQAVEQMAGGAASPTIAVTVMDTTGVPLAGITVYAFDGTTYSGYSKATDANGMASITLPAGSYRFRADVDGTQFWSSTQNDCTIGQCTSDLITVPQPVLVTVKSTDGTLMSGLSVYAFDSLTYSSYSGATNASGQVSLRLPPGNYRFRADFNGTQFWSNTQDDCAVPGCTLDSVIVTQPVVVTVLDNLGMPHSGLPVYAFNGTTYSGISGTTGSNGQVSLTLPIGSYHFRADYNPQGGAGGGTQFWDSSQNDCTVPGCIQAAVSITLPVLVTVQDTDGAPKSGLKVYAFNGAAYTGYSGTTNANGQVMMTLPQGSYRFRADLNGTQFWDSAQNDCTIPACSSASITVTKPMTVTVQDTDGTTQSGLKVYAFNGSTYSGYSGTTNANGQVMMTLPQGSYRFRADLNGTQFWSNTQNDCTLPGCSADQVTVTKPVTVTVQNAGGTPQSGVKVYAFSGSTYSGYSGASNANGNVIFTLPQGSYRFRADYNPQGGASGGTQYWSNSSNDCTIPGCMADQVTVGSASTPTGASTALPTPENTVQASTPAPAPSSTPTPASTNTPAPSNTPAPTDTPVPTVTPAATLTQTGMNAVPQAFVFAAAYRPINIVFADQPTAGTTTPAPTMTATHPAPGPVTVIVQDTNNAPQSGLKVYVFNGTVYTGFNDTTNSNGQVNFTLAQGSYRFRADLNGTQFWSNSQNDCTVPGCASDSITVTLPVTITVKDTNGTAKAGLSVYTFEGSAYTGYHAITDSNGQAVMTLPQGGYRFRADLNGTQFWSSDTNNCAIPGCTTQQITVTNPVTITVQDTDGTAKSGLPVYAFDGTTYTSYNGTTDANGQVTLTLPQGSYRFRADLNPQGTGTGGTQFWSSDTNDCTVVSTSSSQVPGCATASIAVTKPLVLTVQSQTGQPYPNLPVYAFNGTTYTGYSGMTNASGQVTLTLPQGSYRFRADYKGVQFWSGDQNDCTVPGCLSAMVTLPGGNAQHTVKINYTYDALDRLTSATYSDGNAFAYVYDAAGNVLQYTQTTTSGTVTTTYTYNAANELLTGQLGNSPATHYTYDADGNLLSNGVNTYSYDSADRLISVSNQSSVFSYQYDGLGQRLSMSAAGVTTQYVLDGNNPLMATATGKTTFYLYGMGAIGQMTDSWSYDLSDGTNTPRQLVDASGEITFAARYTPWGDTLESNGTGNMSIGYLGGLMDTSTGLLYMGNGQYYDPTTGRFLNRNANPNSTNPYVPWGGNPTGALITPLALLSLLYSRKKKRGTLDTIIILMVLGMSLGLGLSACQTTLQTPIGIVTVTPLSSQNEGQNATTLVTVTPSPTSSPVPTPTLACIVTTQGTPTPNGQMFYNAVWSNRNSLPAGFSVALLLAMGEQESGGVYNYDNTLLGGVMQLRDSSGNPDTTKYTNTQESYNTNVRDALAKINTIYQDMAQQNKPYTLLFDCVVQPCAQTPNSSDVVMAVRTVLYYNQGFDWIRSYRDPRFSMNEGYLGAVARKLESNVPQDFCISDPGLVDPLKRAQQVVDLCVNTTKCGY